MYKSKLGDSMNIIKKLVRYVVDEDYRFSVNNYLGLYKSIEDEDLLKRFYKLRMGKELNLENPQTFNEKLQWLKLNDRNPLYTKLVDKCDVKKYVSGIIGEEYIIPTLGIWDKPEDIDFETLPEQFVLKCTHDCGGLVICKDKRKLDKKQAIHKLNKSLKRNYYWISREWPYKNVKPRIIAEEYMEDTETSELRDYKFFCFNGQPKALFVATERQLPGEEVKFDFFDMEYNHLNIKNGHPNAKKLPKKPLQFELMKELARKLSKDIPQVRVDFYEVNGKVYFGEMTFFHFGGIVPFEPEEWDYKFGEWIVLPEKQ